MAVGTIVLFLGILIPAGYADGMQRNDTVGYCMKLLASSQAPLGAKCIIKVEG